MDVDGTMTDGRLYYSSNGEEMKSFHSKDGYAIKKVLPELGIIPVIVTGRQSAIVMRRASELGITEVYQGIEQKLECVEEILRKYNVNHKETAYIGDDYNDLDLIKICGFTACPKDAVDEVKERADIILRRNGGEGAVSEFIDEIKKIKG